MLTDPHRPLGAIREQIGQNVVAGPAMTRRATYMYGPLLPKGPRGHVDAGLGQGIPLLGTQALLAPTEEVSATGTELVVDGVVDKARASFDEGDYRWVVEVVNHVVFAEPDHVDARHLQADALEQLGYQAESAPWRDFYLTGAQELRHGTPPSSPGSGPGADTVAAMTTEMLFDYLAIRIDGLRAAKRTWSIDVSVTDRSERWLVGVERGALHAHRATSSAPAPVVVTATHAGLAALVFAARPLDDLEGDGMVTVAGDRNALVALLAVCDRFSLMFPIVTP